VVSSSGLHQDARGLVSHNYAFIVGVGGSGLRQTPRSARCVGMILTWLDFNAEFCVGEGRCALLRFAMFGCVHIMLRVVFISKTLCRGRPLRLPMA
jgi:hypothetical protein